MSCRSTAAGSAFTTWARLESNLNDVQTISAFHGLRREGGDAEAPSQQEWEQFLGRARQQIERNPAFTLRRRQSLIRRLEAATAEVPDGRTFRALRMIRSRTGMQGRMVNLQLEQVAAQMDVDMDVVRERYQEYQDDIDRNRTARAVRPDGYDDDAIATARLRQLPEDRGSVLALQRLQAEAAAALASRVQEQPPRIVRQTYGRGQIAEAGYDPDGGRLEVVFRRGDGVSRVYAYHSVPAEVWETMRTAEVPNYAYNEHVRNNSTYRYESQEAADLDAAARRCRGCGQYAGAGHQCPTTSTVSPPAPTVPEPTVPEPLSTPAPAAVTDPAPVVEPEPSALDAAESIDPDDQPVETDEATESAEPEAEAAEPNVERPTPRHSRFDIGLRPRTVRPNGRISGHQGRYDAFEHVSATRVRAEAASGPVIVPIYAHFARYRDDNEAGIPRYYGPITGELVVDRPARGQITAEPRNLRCNCPAWRENGHCPHVDLVAEEYRSYYLPTPAGTGTSRTPATPEQIAQVHAAAEEARRHDWMREEQTAAEARRSWAATDRPEDRVSEHFEVFEAAHDAALARRTAGENPIPYMRENVMDGLCTPESGVGFGVELEFDFPAGTDRYTALQRIGEEMHAAGLTRSPRQAHYHSDANTYRQHEGGWKFEHDQTVSGEIISPVMHDTPETWQRLEQVCDIIRRNGGIATARTGSHVHVSSPNTTPQTAAELVRTVVQHEDVMYRISSNPARRAHRAQVWCGFNRDAPPTGYASVERASDDHTGHNLGLNLQSVTGGAGDHVEVRHWDGTLDPSVIQTQVKVSAALLEAARRNAGNPSVLRQREPAGSHARRMASLRGRSSRRRLTSEELAEDSATARSFADTLFRRPEDKEQFAALYAVTNWFTPAVIRPRRGRRRSRW